MYGFLGLYCCAPCSLHSVHSHPISLSLSLSLSLSVCVCVCVCWDSYRCGCLCQGPMRCSGSVTSPLRSLCSTQCRSVTLSTLRASTRISIGRTQKFTRFPCKELSVLLPPLLQHHKCIRACVASLPRHTAMSFAAPQWVHFSVLHVKGCAVPPLPLLSSFVACSWPWWLARLWSTVKA